MKKNALPIFLTIVFCVLYYFVQYFVQNTGEIEIGMLIGAIILDAIFNIVIAFFFGFFILGLLGIACAKLFFNIQLFFSRKKDVSEKYIILKTAGTVTGWLLVKRAFLFYCIAISLTLTTLQVAGFINPGYLADLGTASGDQPPYQDTFTLLYTILVFTYAAGITLILPPIWILDDVNLMYFTEDEGMKYLNPVGQSVLPALKGFGSFNIIIAYLVFVATRFSATASLGTLLDPVLTLFLPIVFLLGFDVISDYGQKNIRKWLINKGVQSYESMRIELIKASGDYRFKMDGPEGETTNKTPDKGQDERNQQEKHP